MALSFATRKASPAEAAISSNFICSATNFWVACNADGSSVMPRILAEVPA
jgi:hypothetical protein